MTDELRTVYKVETWSAKSRVTMTTFADDLLDVIDSEMRYRYRLKQKPLHMRITIVDD